MDFWLDVIKVIGSIIVSMAVCFAVYYIFFKPLLKKPKEEPDSVGDMIYSVKSHAQENHNEVLQNIYAVLQNSDSVRKSLTDEHNIIREKIDSVDSEITSLAIELNSVKQLIVFLIERDRENTSDIINKISALQETLKAVKYENKELKAEISSLKHQIEVQSCTINYPTRNMHL